jgi:hypothetical protein
MAPPIFAVWRHFKLLDQGLERGLRMGGFSAFFNVVF